MSTARGARVARERADGDPRHMLRTLALGLADLVLPASCVVCGRPGGDACVACVGPLHEAPRRRIPDPEPPGLVPVWSVADYDPALTRLIVAYKEEGRAALAAPLGTALATAVAGALRAQRHTPRAGRGVVLVPAPSARSATRRRGRDPAAALAGAAADRLRACGIDTYVVPLLVQARPLQDQAGLSAVERARNLHGALTARDAALARLRARPPSAVVLVDDVLTTGATLAEAGRALAAVGLPAVAGATIAATVRRRRIPGRPA